MPLPIDNDDENDRDHGDGRDEDYHEAAEIDDAPFYRYSWKRSLVVVTALLTLPAWGPWVQRHIGFRALLLLIPFAAIFAFSLWCLTLMFANRSLGKRDKRK